MATPAIFTPLNEVGFPEFTTKLIKDTFDTLISANINQMQAYSELLSETQKTLSQYVADNYQSISADEIYDFLASVPLNSTLGVTDLITTTGATPVSVLNNATSLLPGPGSSTPLRLLDLALPTTLFPGAQDEFINLTDLLKPIDSSIIMITGGSAGTTVEELEKYVAKYLSGKKYEILQAMVKMGLLRLVVTNGRMEAMLNYQTYQSAYATQIGDDVKSKGFGAGLTGGYESNSRLKKGVSKLFKLAGSANYTNVRVSTSVNTSSSSASQSINVMGKVIIDFKTDYQPLDQ